MAEKLPNSLNGETEPETLSQKTQEGLSNQSGSASRSLKDKGKRSFFVFLTVALFAVVVGGLFWAFAFSTASPVGLGWFLFAFAAGLSMIVLPCTLPLAFVIVPLSIGKGYVKGFAIAISFGIGVAITLSMYGILAAVLGKTVAGFSGGTGEVLKGWFYLAAGIVALIFALGELGLIKFRLPSYSGAVPAFIQKRKDLLRPLLMGLFLGNIGVGCPHPATPILLARIAVEGSVFYGWFLFFVHAIGRVIPLLVLALLGIIGVNAIKVLVRHREKLVKISAWFMIFVGAFLFTFGLFSHDWWVSSGQHTIFEEIVQEERFTGILKARLDSEVTHDHGAPTGTGMFGLPLWLGNWVLVALWILPLWWYWFRERRKARALEKEKGIEQFRVLRWMGAFFVTLSLLLGIIFIYILPHRFLVHMQEEAEHQEISEIIKR